MKNAFRKLILPLRRAAIRFVTPEVAPAPPTYISSPDSVIYKAANFVAVNRIPGDYLEFGVFQGASFVHAYHTLRHCFDEVVSRWGFTMSAEDRILTSDLFQKMRFFAFDSFEGLPPVADIDKSGFFGEGQFKASLDNFKRYVDSVNFPSERNVVVDGWYDKSLTHAVYDQHQLTRAAIVHIDCDLYESTRLVLNFITPLLVDGTVLIFDDWFHFNGNPARGEQKAFREWIPKLTNWSFTEFQQEGTWLKSFIANKH